MTKSILFGVRENDELCSNWLVLYFNDIVLHWFAIIGIGVMIAKKNGQAFFKLYQATRIQEPQEIEMNVLKVSTIQVGNCGL